MQEYYFDEIESTQDYAKKIYLDNKRNFVVFSDKQTLGRGRNDHKWEAPSGGLWFSFDIDFFDAGSLFTLAIGVATREVLKEFYGSNVKLKWPNDLILDGKKAGGIICEKINDRVIVGIGINTNVKIINEPKAITFFNTTGLYIDNYKLMNSIINRCREVLTSRLAEVVENFRNNMAYKGEKCFVTAINKVVKVLDINNKGFLVVETENEIKEVFAGEINVCI